MAVAELKAFVGKELWDNGPAWSLQSSCELIPIQQFCVSNGAHLLEAFDRVSIPVPERIYMLRDERRDLLHGSTAALASEFQKLVRHDEIAFFELPVKWILAVNHDGCLFYHVPNDSL